VKGAGWRARRRGRTARRALFGVVEQLTTWCNEQRITAARVIGIGGFSTATVAWFDWQAREFREIAVAEQVEL
jgi:predicted DNA-binding protein with PD1-like motif